MRTALLLLTLPLIAACATTAVEREAPGHPDGVVFRWRQRLDEHGRIPDRALLSAKATRDATLAAQPLSAGTGGPRNWTWRGPGNIGGRLRAIVIHPTQPATMWVGSASGGIWKTVNGGSSWEPLNDFISCLTVGCLTLDPIDPDLLYAGTGEGVFDTVEGSSNSAAIQGAGIFRSADGGAHWSQLPATATADWYYVNRIAISPADRQRLLAATGSGLWLSSDGGLTWSRRTTGRTLDVDFHPTDGSRAVAGRADGVAQYSTDAGVTWSGATGLPANGTRVEVAYARSSPATVYATVTTPGTGINDALRVWRSTDGGATWALRTSGSGITTYDLYNVALWVDPTNPAFLVVGGVNMYRSTDSGATLASISSGIHADMHVVVEHPGFNGTTNRTVFAGNDGGIHRAADIQAASLAWQALNNNLGVTQFYGAAVNPTSGVLIGGTQDNGTLRTTGSTSWSSILGGDGGFCAADPTDPNYFYCETQFLRIYRSTTGGPSPALIAGGISETRPNFIPFFLLDPNNPNRMLGCGANLWRSDNVKAASPTWTIVKPALSCPPFAPGGAVPPNHFEDNPPCNISTVAVAEGNANVVWVGHNNGHLYKTINGTAPAPTWVKVDENAPGLPDRWVSRIVIDRGNHDRVYVCFLGYTPDNVWRTTDGGASWSRITGTLPAALPAIPVAGLALHRLLPGRLYAGTDLGLYWSDDDGATWSTSNDGPGLAPIEELIWRDARTLLAVTHGRGVYQADAHDAASATPVGTGCGILGPPVLTAAPPVIGTTQAYALSGAAPVAPVILALGFGPATPTPFPGGCTAQVSIAGLVSIPAGATNAQGAWSFSIALPFEAALLGLVLTAQDLILVNGGPLLGSAELSNGVELRVGL
jgi:photosystem II stability/assembly factor-like uncharacterized protein